MAAMFNYQPRETISHNDSSERKTDDKGWQGVKAMQYGGDKGWR